MSKSKQNKSFLSKKALNNLLSQQNKIKEKYESFGIAENNKKIAPYQDSNDFYEDNFDNIKHTLKELPQYSSLYLKRLEMTKTTLLEESKKKWPKIQICPNILDLKGKVRKFFLIIFYFLERINYYWINI